MTNMAKQFIKLFTRILITVGLLFLVFSRIDFSQLVSVAASARWEFLALIWFLTVIAFWLQAAKMHLILKEQNCDIKISKAFGISSITLLYSMILPGILSASVKWLYLKQQTGKGSNVFSSMVYNQFAEIVVTIIPRLLALIIANPTGQWHLPAVSAILLALIIVACLLLLCRHTAAKINSFLQYILRPLPRKLRKGGKKVIGQIETFQTITWWFHLKMLLLTTVVIVIGAVIYFLAAKGANINVPVGTLVWLYVTVALLGRIPIAIANLGVREVVLVGLLAIYNVEAPAALLMSMIIFSSSIFMAVIGGFYQLIWAAQIKETKAQPTPQSSQKSSSSY